jgi:PIN domain nuclease of toxin-antitoxin system
MRLLLDTNAFLWWRDASPRLSKRVGDLIRDPANQIAVSIASFWEIAIKRSLGKLGYLEDFEEVMAEEDFHLLAVAYTHLRALERLPPHHGDPFDRLLISQSISEGTPIATSDRAFAQYDVRTLW